MRMTTRGRYALRAAIALARESKDGVPISIGIIAEQEDISSVFLEQIFFKLRKAGIVNSVRGPGGGFCFAQPLNTVTLKKILDAAGESLVIAPCKVHNNNCSKIKTCFAHTIWQEATDLLNNYFDGLTVDAILQKMKV